MKTIYSKFTILITALLLLSLYTNKSFAGGAPANNACASATLLTVNAACTTTAGTTNNATAQLGTAGYPSPGCAGSVFNEVWYQFVAPANGTVTIDTQTGVITDSGMGLYSGTCGSLTLIECDDDDSPNGAMSMIARSGLTAGATYYIAVWEYGGDNDGSFSICITSPPACNLTGTTTVDMTANTCNVACPATITFRDPQGAANYNASQDITQTFTNSGGSPLQVSFSVFDTESCCDELYIYDGPSSASPQVAGSPFRGTTLPPNIVSSGASLTFQFTPDGSTNGAGFVSQITCLAACAGMPTAGTATASPTAVCSGGSTNLSVTGATSASGLTYQWQSSTNNTTWTNVAGATSSTHTISPAANTYYRRIITCGGNSANSASILVTVGSPANDECAGATLLTVNSDFNCGTVTAGTINCASASAQANSCFGTDDDDVWYRFVATSTMHRVSLLNVAGSVTDMYHTVYSGTCATPGTELVCSDADISNLSGLTIGATYYVRVYSYTGTAGQNTTFNICIGSPAVCNIAANTTIDMSDFGNCTITNCGATVTFRDPQGNANYNPSQDVTHVFTNGGGTPLQAVFNVFDTESCCDELYIYDGPSTASPQVAGSPFMGTTLPPTIISSGASLTFRFTPDGSTNGAGFRALINCLPACSGTPTGGAAAASQTVICSAQNVNLNVTGGTAASSLTYQWQSSPDNATWSNIGGATAGVATVNVTTTTHYRRLTTCTVSGASAASSSVMVMMNSNACNFAYTSTTITTSYDTWVLGNALTFGDDQLSAAKVPLGFTFCFDGRPYTDAYISSNFAIVFDAVCGVANVSSGVAAPAASNGYSISGNMPSATQTMPRNAIMLWHDVDPGDGGDVTYQTLGTAPNRRFVLSFREVPMFSCTTLMFNGQIKIYETTNAIELHIDEKVVCSTFNSGNAAMGIQNYDGTSAVVPANKNGLDADWTVTNQGWRFTTTCPTCIIPLSINIKDFDAKPVDGANEVKWETASEKNNNLFVVQKSRDGQNFEDFEAVKSKSDNGAQYKVFDKQPFEIETYYRLKYVDLNGVAEYSNIESVQNTTSLKDFYLQPNPANDLVTIGFNSKSEAKGEIEIIDLSGRKLLSNPVSIQNGNNEYLVKLDNFDSGVYFVKIYSNGSLLNSSKLIKQ